ncbi:hypothetical protein CRUP_026522, partial [Coryphaenoides rupestris]
MSPTTQGKPATVVSSGVGGCAELSLAEVQCHLDREGASDLVIDLIMNATSDRIFQESILLAIALLEGGNTVIQVPGAPSLDERDAPRRSGHRSFFHRLTGDNKSEKFFKVFYERMKLAQQEIKATVTVNTSDLGSKKKEEEPPHKDKDTAGRKKAKEAPPAGGTTTTVVVVASEEIKEQLVEATLATKKAFTTYRREVAEAAEEQQAAAAAGDGAAGVGGAAAVVPAAGDKNQEDGEMS